MHLPSIYRSARRVGFLLALSAITYSASIAAADQTYSVQLHLSRGDKWNFDATTSMNQKGAVLANGQLAQPIDQSFSQRRKGTIELLAVENGVPESMRITYDPESNNGGNVGAQQQQPPFKLAGKTVVVTRKDGVVTTDLGKDADASAVQELTHMLDPDTSIYPKGAVAINEEWDGDTVASAKAYQLGPDDKISIKCKLLQVHNVDGRQTAEVGLTGTMLKHDQGFLETHITLQGASQIDMQTGQAVESDMTGKMTMKGDQQSAGPDGKPVKISVSASGDIKVQQSVKVLNFEAPAAPAQANGPSGNPLPMPHGEGGAFAGVFKGDQVAIELTDAAGQITGTLTVGDKKYPVTAKSDGNKLTGSFESDGSKFDFNASLDGTTLTLTSEGNTYTLKKPAVNPLARPQPKNPLAAPEPKNPLAQ